MNSPAYALSHLSEISHYGVAALFANTVTKEKSLHAGIAISKGSVFATCQASSTFTKPNKYTVQAGEENHIVPSPAFLQYLNHSCNPNIFFDPESMQLTSLRDIAIGDELTFFYPSTEWAMAEPFQCFCGAPNCIHQIQGAAFLPTEILKNYKFTNFIRQKLKKVHQQKAGSKSDLKKFYGSRL